MIVSYGGRPIVSIDDLHRLLTSEQVGVSSELTVVRRVEKVALTIQPGEAPPRRVA